MVLWGKKKKYLENEIFLKNRIREVKGGKKLEKEKYFFAGERTNGERKGGKFHGEGKIGAGARLG